MMRTFTFIAAMGLFASAAAQAPESSVLFHELLDEHWRHQVQEKIFFRTDPDAWRPDGDLSQHTAEARERRKAFNEGMLERGVHGICPRTVGVAKLADVLLLKAQVDCVAHEV